MQNQIGEERLQTCRINASKRHIVIEEVKATQKLDMQNRVRHTTGLSGCSAG